MLKSHAFLPVPARTRIRQLSLVQKSANIFSMAGARKTLTDQVLLLVFAGMPPARGRFLGRTRITKAFFRAELEQRGKIAAPDYCFYRWAHGPFSKELYEDLGELGDAGLLSDTTPTKRGAELAEFLYEKLASKRIWSEIFSTLLDAQKFVLRMDTQALKNWSHAVVVKPTGGQNKLRIHDMPECRDIINPRVDGGTPLDLPQDIAEIFEFARGITEDDVKRMKKLG